jgi:nitric oxide dioxygenase
MPLTQEQVQTIKATVPVLKDHGDAITASFYDTLLKDIPDLKNVFNQANQRNRHQAQALAGALYAYASHVDDLGVLAPALERICHKHASLYIQPAQYEVVGIYLLRAMGDVLGSALTPAVLEAWRAAYSELANLMMEREEQLLDEYTPWRDWREFKIADKVSESDEITSFYLKPVDGQALPKYLPGQYISVLTDVPNFGYLQSRQYSLSDAPREDYYRISIKREEGVKAKDGVAHPGFVSNVMHNKKEVGDIVKVSRPAGEFFLDPDKDCRGPVILISAGVGLTPMISILNTLLSQNTKHRISFVHGSRKTRSQAFAQLIKDKVAQHESVTATIFIKSPNVETDVQGLDYKHAGRVDLQRLDFEKDLCLDDSRTTYFVCGPDSFMADIRSGLRQRGVDEDRIRMEVFGTGMVPSTKDG